MTEREKRKKECFGLPGGSSIIGLFIGLIILIVGFQQIFKLSIDIGPAVIIIVGLFFIGSAIYGIIRKRN